jgi:AcrR family transcriptional regulator
MRAAEKVLREFGFPDSSLTQIARLAGVGTPALYRRWGSKSELALQLIARQLLVDAPDTGDIRKDLTAFVRLRIGTFSSPLFAHVLLGLTTVAGRHPKIAQGVADLFASAQQPMLDRLQLAHDRGELPPDADPKLILDMAVGAVAIPLLFTQQSRQESEAETIVAAVFDGLVRAAR